MLILVSPAKTLDYESELDVKDFSVAPLLSDSELLIKELQQKNPDDLSSLMGLSEKLSLLNFDRNMNWTRPTKPSDSARQAIFAFKGDVYQGLDASSLSKSEIKYANKNLCILSGLYGLLKPLDLMYPYRLEMGTKMKNKRGNNLYEFWGSKVTELVNDLAMDNRSKAIVNLASVEYFSVLKTDQINLPIINPVFKDYKNGQYKIVSFFAKKARGLMSRFIIQNKIKKSEDLMDFNLDGYRYSKKESKENSPVFLRKN
ncbi:MAG: peroxide stress protein YaaA [Gammaproteobacteria bacterium]|nr:peroxide stress protein YaaA [Gammaproteobacteria bacterium]RZP02329.1 MAG: peroxide stress protein YaaA [Gammaproteobacteria bacterium]|tara:strand:- start:183 stop:956 length:774 start_codon:yes stop_codon:yes gene_type:complete